MWAFSHAALVWGGFAAAKAVAVKARVRLKARIETSAFMIVSSGYREHEASQRKTALGWWKHATECRDRRDLSPQCWDFVTSASSEGLNVLVGGLLRLVLWLAPNR